MPELVLLQAQQAAAVPPPCQGGQIGGGYHEISGAGSQSQAPESAGGLAAPSPTSEGLDGSTDPWMVDSGLGAPS